MRLFQNKSMRQSHCFYYYMDGMFLSECISKSFLEIRVSQREKCKQIFVINSGEHEHTGSSLWWIISLFFLFHFPNLFLFYFAQ